MLSLDPQTSAVEDGYEFGDVGFGDRCLLVSRMEARLEQNPSPVWAPDMGQTDGPGSRHERGLLGGMYRTNVSRDIRCDCCIAASMLRGNSWTL